MVPEAVKERERVNLRSPTTSKAMSQIKRNCRFVVDFAASFPSLWPTFAVKRDPVSLRTRGKWRSKVVAEEVMKMGTLPKAKNY